MNKNKEEIRRTMRKLNQTMRNGDHGAEDMATVTALLNASIFHKSDRIFAFMPLFSEVDITPVLQAALKTKRLALPRSNGDDTLTFVEMKSLDELMPGRFGILEPGADVEIQPTPDSLIIVPALAYTPKRARLRRWSIRSTFEYLSTLFELLLLRLEEQALALEGRLFDAKRKRHAPPVSMHDVPMILATLLFIGLRIFGYE